MWAAALIRAITSACSGVASGIAATNAVNVCAMASGMDSLVARGATAMSLMSVCWRFASFKMPLCCAGS